MHMKKLFALIALLTAFAFAGAVLAQDKPAATISSMPWSSSMYRARMASSTS